LDPGRVTIEGLRRAMASIGIPQRDLTVSSRKRVWLAAVEGAVRELRGDHLRAWVERERQRGNVPFAGPLPDKDDDMRETVLRVIEHIAGRKSPR
jgi:hypothetical protein